MDCVMPKRLTDLRSLSKVILSRLFWEKIYLERGII